MNGIKPLRAVIRLKNNAIIERRERLGYESCARFCREMKLNYSAVISLESANHSPFAKNGSLNLVPRRLCEALGASPNELWPEEVLALEKNVATHLLDGHDIRALPGYSVALIDERSVADRLDNVDVAERALSCMRDRDAYVVRRIAVDQVTLEEVGEELRLSKERVRALYNRGLRDAQRKLHRTGTDSDELWDWQ